MKVLRRNQEFKKTSSPQIKAPGEMMFHEFKQMMMFLIVLLPTQVLNMIQIASYSNPPALYFLNIYRICAAFSFPSFFFCIYPLHVIVFKNEQISVRIEIE